MRLIKDSTITVTTDKAFAETCSAENLYVDYDNICKMLQVGSLIYLDDGLLSLRVESISADFVSCQCTVMNEGGLSSKKGVNLPNIDVDLPAVAYCLGGCLILASYYCGAYLVFTWCLSCGYLVG